MKRKNKMEVKQICELIETRQNELFELLGSMIKINSENLNGTGNEKNLAEYLVKICNELGLENEKYSPLDIEGFSEHPDYIPGHNLEERYNVTARWNGKENTDELMLMGHSDTVKIGNLENWEFEPLLGEVRDGKVLGRGACDDKYALATALFVIKILKEQGFTPKSNILFTAYCDEEYGGSHGALAAVLRYPCDRIVNMDCKENLIWHCGSGGQEVKYLFHTKEPVDSAKYAARAIPVIMDVVEEFAARRRDELEQNRFYKGTIIPKTSLRYMGVRAGNNGSDLGAGEVYFVFYTDKTKEEIYKEFAEMEKVLKEKLEPLGIIGEGFKPQTRFFHYVFCEPDSEDIKNMLAASREATGKEPLVCGSCLSDLSVIMKYGKGSSYGFGIGRDFNSEGGAHQPNEFIECEKLVNYAKTIAAYILKTC